MSDAADKNREESNGFARKVPDRREIEDMIQEAMAAGKFDNLRGKGKPLSLRRNPYATETELADKILKDNDFTLPWIADRTAILNKIAALRAEIAYVWQQYSHEYRVVQGDGHRTALELGWYDELTGWEARIVKLNKEIADLNLRLPLDHLEVFKLDLARELKRAEASRSLASTT